MDSTRQRKSKITKKYKETVENMKNVGTFRAEFDSSVRRYAELSVQYDALSGQWYDGGCQITESYTNKAGATNQRKTALYLALENLRRELIELENVFGLTPKGLKQIRAKSLEPKKESTLEKMLGDSG